MEVCRIVERDPNDIITILQLFAVGISRKILHKTLNKVKVVKSVLARGVEFRMLST